MSQDYCELSGDDYEQVYARYLVRPTRLLVAPDPAVALDENTRLLDLCSGSGAVVKGAMNMGVKPSNIVAVDNSLRMLRDNPAGNTIDGSVGYPALYDHLAKRHEPFNLITCRQAVNYWWGHLDTVVRIVGLLAPRGCFVFNTFNTKPDPTPQVREYEHEGARFAEIAYCVGDVIHHAQACEGFPMHLTTFRWIPPDEFESDLNLLGERGRIAEWARAREGRTDTYVVRAK